MRAFFTTLMNHETGSTECRHYYGRPYIQPPRDVRSRLDDDKQISPAKLGLNPLRLEAYFTDGLRFALSINTSRMAGRGPIGQQPTSRLATIGATYRVPSPSYGSPKKGGSA